MYTPEDIQAAILRRAALRPYVPVRYKELAEDLGYRSQKNLKLQISRNIPLSYLYEQNVRDELDARIFNVLEMFRSQSIPLSIRAMRDALGLHTLNSIQKALDRNSSLRLAWDELKNTPLVDQTRPPKAVRPSGSNPAVAHQPPGRKPSFIFEPIKAWAMQEKDLIARFRYLSADQGWLWIRRHWRQRKSPATEYASTPESIPAFVTAFTTVAKQIGYSLPYPALTAVRWTGERLEIHIQALEMIRMENIIHALERTNDGFELQIAVHVSSNQTVKNSRLLQTNVRFLIQSA